MATYKLHPLCEKFPAMPEDEFNELVEDMRVHGQRDPIWVFGKFLLDGKHRLDACERLSLKPDVREFRTKHGPEEPQIRAFVLSKNFYRRHLNASQRAIIVAEMVTTKRAGRPEKELPINAQLTQTEAAGIASVSRASVQQAAEVLESGSTALVNAVKAGEVSVADAAKVVDLPKSEQTAAVREVLSGEEKTVAAAAGAKPKPRKKKSKADTNGHAESPLPIPEREPGEDDVEPEHDEGIADEFGPIPKKLRAVFAERSTFRGIVNKLGRIQSEIEDLQRSDAGAALPINEILKDLPKIQAAVKFATPFCECPKCRRKVSESCKACSGVGWITEATWNRCKTKEDEQWLKNR